MNQKTLAFQSSYIESLSFIDIILILSTIFFIVYLILGTPKGKLKNFLISLMIIFLTLSIFDIYSMKMNSNQVRYAFENKSYKIIEGKISNFHAMSKGGHDTESFDVNGIHFEIRFTGNYPGKKTLYYTLTKNRNGPIKENGQEVIIYYLMQEPSKICIPWTQKCIHFNRGTENKIIKLWVYNYQ